MLFFKQNDVPLTLIDVCRDSVRHEPKKWCASRTIFSSRLTMSQTVSIVSKSTCLSQVHFGFLFASAVRKYPNRLEGQPQCSLHREISCTNYRQKSHHCPKSRVTELVPRRTKHFLEVASFLAKSHQSERRSDVLPKVIFAKFRNTMLDAQRA